MTLTALKQYQRLECTGLWQEHPEAQRRDVVVGIGETSLVLRDPRNEQVLSHWSLPAVVRLNAGATPALFQPGSDATETLELTDPDMIAALETLRKAIAAARPQPGRLRGAMYLFAGIIIGGLLVQWFPGALRDHTLSVVPPSVRAEIGQNAFDELVRLTGTPCNEPQAQAALAGLSTRLAGGDVAPILLVLREGLTRPGALPGDIILLPRNLIEGQDSPQAVAEATAAMARAAQDTDPLLPILTHAGLRATFTLLTTGKLPPAAIQGYGETFLRSSVALPANPAAAPPIIGLPDPVMPDADWVALQAICDI